MIWPFMLWAVIILGPFVAWLLFRGPGYKRVPLDRPPGPAWIASGERFVDPRSGALVEVWSDPRSGERAYVLSRITGPARL